MATLVSRINAITEANELLAAHAALILRVRQSQADHRANLEDLESPPTELLELPLIPTPSSTPPPEPSASPEHQTFIRHDLPPNKRARVARYRNYVPEEETIRNDYSQRYVDGGEWPQNWVLGAEPEHRFEEYPKQQRLLTLKKIAVNEHALPPSYLPFSALNSLQPAKFDVILLDPPFSSSFTWDHLQDLPIPTLAGDPSFIFMWVGSGAGEGLERGREILAKWGYRRCEDVVWVKTNKTTNQGPGTDPPTTSILTRTKQHCLIGIRGTVRRSTDNWFVHCNVDTDVIIWEGDPADPTRKPPEMYTLIENFCLGLRRLEVFGRLSSLRRGWVTVLGSPQDDKLPVSEGSIHVPGEEGGIATRWFHESWEEGIKEISNGGKAVVSMSSEIDQLRPKSPVRGGQGGGGGGQGGHSGLPPPPSNLPSTQATPMAGPNRFINNNRGNNNNFMNTPPGGMNVNLPSNMLGQNPMMNPGMMAMGGHHQMGVGMGHAGMGVDDMAMNNWNPMMNGMNVGAMGGMATPMANRGMGGMGNHVGMAGMMNAGNMMNVNNRMGNLGGGMGMGNVNPMMAAGMNAGGMGGLPMGMMGQMGQMGMGNAFGQMQAGQQVFNNNMNNWNEQGWDGEGGMMMGGISGGVGMGVNNNMGMGQQWRPPGSF
ncbi:MT-A70-domain-containing protein [Panaeolus papilionaceus]|nr:MT-A70-domain-containing protein [Panaeolus papilionaceus]